MNSHPIAQNSREKDSNAMKSTDQWDFEDEDQAKEISELGKKLSQSGKPKDVLVKLLKVLTPII